MQSQFDAEPAGPLVLPPHGSTVVAEDLRVRLVLASDVDGDIVVDGSDVESIGQAVLQLLIAGREEAERNGHGFTIANPSAPLRSRLEACGLATLFGLEEEDQVQ
ncbi:STAS domain-containing protein [Sphingomonas parva]|uniref:STAS domain-containing protein n=1 Tax=Sphingomonas parva TaxID=2555898 RepID=A0A4Y8ZUA6_9SPHN|nr:STAS domain-containing protein [Sphingomonas parva]TFI59590.1 STAS domain-containing protein [Sphingomonas parva]